MWHQYKSVNGIFLVSQELELFDCFLSGDVVGRIMLVEFVVIKVSLAPSVEWDRVYPVFLSEMI